MALEDGLRPTPPNLSPMLTTHGELPEPDHGWCYEVRFGGVRVMIRVDSTGVDLLTPDGSATHRPELAGLAAQLGGVPALLDGEIDGTPPGLWITDLLHIDGRDVTALPYRERRALAESLPLTGPTWRLAPCYPGGGAAVLAAAAEQRLPYVIAKRAESSYQPGVCSSDWVQIAIDTRSASSGPESVRVAGRRVRLSNPNKVLYPAAGFTKRDVLAHYRAVAPMMLAHLANRPVTLRRWPDGVAAGSFFEKNVSRHVPDWVRTVRLDTPGSVSGAEFLDYPLLDDEATLAWVANLAALELHVPQWRVDRDGARLLPDLLVFDLDPGEGTSVVECARVAERIAALLAQDQLPTYPRTSGGKGMQLYSPVRVSTPQHTGEYARAIAELLHADDPDRITSVMAKQRRRGKVLIDWSQNNPVKTTVASYSLRGGPLPTVATPLTWDEVRACELPEQLIFTADALPARLAEHGDLLAPLLTEGYELPGPALLSEM